MELNRRLALLIDGDNAQASLLPQMLAEVSKYGTIPIRRVYGDWTKTQMTSWKEVVHTYALQPVQQFAYTQGKNATDGALIIEAMDILYTAGIDGFCIASSDSDYTGLAKRIRQQNLFVLGVGKKMTPSAFVSACDVFIYTEDLQPVLDAEPKTEPSVPVVPRESTTQPVVLVKSARFKPMFRKAFASAVQDNGWAPLGTLGNYLRQFHPEFSPKDYGHKQLSLLVQAHPEFIEIKKRKNQAGSEEIFVRLKPEPKQTKMANGEK